MNNEFFATPNPNMEISPEKPLNTVYSAGWGLA
jgi:hypothetical protein